MNPLTSKIKHFIYISLGVLFFLIAIYSIIKQSSVDNHIQNLYPDTSDHLKYQLPWQKEFYFNRINEFKNNPIGYNKIVFLGNSITKGGGDWGQRFNASNIVNRGISGDYTEGILNRLNEIIFYKPIAVFILIGVNEFFKDNTNNLEVNPTYVANNIIKIKDKIKNGSPSTLVFIQTILPINNQHYMNIKDVNYNFLLPDYSPSVNMQIKKVNSILVKSKKHNLIDLHPLFLNSNGSLNYKFTIDGVHLNQKGYQIWSNKIYSIIESLNN